MSRMKLVCPWRTAVGVSLLPSSQTQRLYRPSGVGPLAAARHQAAVGQVPHGGRSVDDLRSVRDLPRDRAELREQLAGDVVDFDPTPLVRRRDRQPVGRERDPLEPAVDVPPLAHGPAARHVHHAALTHDRARRIEAAVGRERERGHVVVELVGLAHDLAGRGVEEPDVPVGVGREDVQPVG